MYNFKRTKILNTHFYNNKKNKHKNLNLYKK